MCSIKPGVDTVVDVIVSNCVEVIGLGKVAVFKTIPSAFALMLLTLNDCIIVVPDWLYTNPRLVKFNQFEVKAKFVFATPAKRSTGVPEVLYLNTTQ